MLTRLTLAATVSLLLSAQPSAQEKRQPPTAPPQKLNVVLCKTEAQAIALAAELSNGKTEPIAINQVNKSAAAEVCGRYVGHAVVEVEKTTNHHGALFMLAGLRFVEDGTLAWTASWVAPFQGALLERGA
ncbi:MAG TPA: hypothetical protein VLB11_04595 [Methyloceanibacter sp.]|nr:hypothetical protein [Methyloceanibacter sp.]